MCECVGVYCFFFYTITRLVFSIRVTQEGFSKVGKQQHSCPLCVVFTLLSGYSFLSLCPHNMYAHTRTRAHSILPFLRTSCVHVYVSARVFAPTSKSRQRSVTIFNKWISHRRPDSADGAYYYNTVITARTYKTNLTYPENTTVNVYATDRA